MLAAGQCAVALVVGSTPQGPLGKLTTRAATATAVGAHAVAAARSQARRISGCLEQRAFSRSWSGLAIDVRGRKRGTRKHCFLAS